MSIFDRFKKPKCVLCSQRGGELKTSCWHGLYNNKRWFYHDKCLTKVLGDPENYEHLTVDKAIQITERIIEDRKERQKQFEKIGALQVKLLGTPK